MDGDVGHRRGNDEQVALDAFGEQAGGQILIHHGIDALIAPFRTEHRDTTATARDEVQARGKERFQPGLLDDLQRAWRGYVTPEAAPGVFPEHPRGIFAAEELGPLGRVEFAHGLRGIPETGIVLVHDHLRQHGDGILAQAAPEELVLQRLLNLVPNAALRVRHASHQRQAVQPGRGVRDFAPPQQEAHLRAISIGDNHLISQLHEAHDMLSGDAQGPVLILYGLGVLTEDERISPDGDNCDLACRHVCFSRWRVPGYGPTG